jgi:cell division protein FtsN
MGRRYPETLWVILFLVVAGCSMVEENSKKNTQLGLITTPPTYYTTQKARYLGEKYKHNLDRLVERIARNPKTANLQFANNIASVGGIGFFTHSATRSVDERFLEVIMGVPETFDVKLDHNMKLDRVFSLYGTELLSILASDPDIYQEKEVKGYGLNLSWRNLVPDANGPRISLERAILYFSKARVSSFLRGDLSQNILLSEAVIFAVVEDGPMRLVSYRPRELKPDSRSPIQEESLAAGPVLAKPEVKSEESVPLAPVPEPLLTANEQRKSSPGLLSRSNEKPDEPASQPELHEKLEDRTAVASATEKPAEVPAASPTPQLEALNQPKDAVAEKQGLADRTTTLASLEQKRMESQSIAPKENLPSPQATSGSPAIPNAPKVEKSLEEQLREQAPLAEPARTTQTESPVTRLSRQVLQGFVIQLAFGEMRDAQRWAEVLERRGFAVSLTEAGNTGSVRVRLGNFAGREAAERQLQALRQDGLKGIVLNLPEAYRPQIQPVAADSEHSDNNTSAVQ